MTPYVSVVMLCYNHEKYVRTAIESILTQSFTNIELILVDDGSTDSSVAIARGFADARLRIIKKENGGPSDASATGVSMAKAPFIALMSADDVSHVDRLKIQIKEIEEKAADVTFCRPDLISEEGQHLPDDSWPIFFKRSFSSQEDLYRTLFYKGNFICATSVMFRTSLIERFGYVHNGLIQLQDFLWWARLVPNTTFHCSEYRYLFYRVREHDGNLSSKINFWRSMVEKKIVYRDFFVGASRQFLASVFGEAVTLASSDLVFEAQKAKILLTHKDPAVRSVGVEKLIDLLYSQENSHILRKELNLHLKEVYNQAGMIASNDGGHLVSAKKFNLPRIVRSFFSGKRSKS